MSARTYCLSIFVNLPSLIAGKRTELTVGSSQDVTEAKQRALATRIERLYLASLQPKLSLQSEAKIAAAATHYGTPQERPSRTTTRGSKYKSRRMAMSAPGKKKFK
jgi:hypothetical protein